MEAEVRFAEKQVNRLGEGRGCDEDPRFSASREMRGARWEETVNKENLAGGGPENPNPIKRTK